MQANYDLFISNDITFSNQSTQESTEYSLFFSGTATSYIIEPIKNTTFVYALNSETKDALLENSYTMYSAIGFQQASLPILFSILFGLLLIILLTKINFDVYLFGYKFFKAIPVEVHVVCSMFIFFFAVNVSYMAAPTLANEHFFLLNGKADTIFDILYLYGIENYLLWFLVFAYYAYCFLLMKDMTIHHTWKKHIMCVRCITYLNHKYHLTVSLFHSFDLSNADDRRLFKILMINFIILSVIVFFWGFGIFFLVIYSIVIYFFFQKYLLSIRKDYNHLLDVTKQIANGDLTSDIQINLGLFHEFKDNLVDIQDGFKRAVDEEVASQRMKTELITNVSHDLKTPLTSIISYIDLLKKEDISEADRKKYLDTLDRNSIRLKHLIEDLFEVSKANSGNVKLERIQMDLCALMTQVQVELEDKLQAQALLVKNNFSDEKIMIVLDPQKTYRILENLINNIAKYALKGTRVYIDINDYNTYVDVTIKNVSATELNFDPEEISERFTRGDASRNTEGSGLGLAIAKSFTELHGGKMRIQIDGDLFKVSLHFPRIVHKS